MPIPVTCPSGHFLVAQDQYAGAKAMCPTCRAIVVVPPLVPPPAAVPVAQVAAPEEEEFKLVEIEDLPSPLAAPLVPPPAAVPVAQVAGPVAEEFKLVEQRQELSLAPLLAPPLPPFPAPLVPLPAAVPVVQVAEPELEEFELVEEVQKLPLPLSPPLPPPPAAVPVARVAAPEEEEFEVLEEVEELPPSLPPPPKPPLPPPPLPWRERRWEPALRVEKQVEIARRPSRRKRGRRRDGMSLVRLGLGFHFAGLVTSLICFPLTFIVVVAFSLARNGTGPGGFAQVMLGLVSLGSFLSLVLWLTGSVLCLWVPSGSHARGLIWSSLVCDVVGLIAQGIALALPGAPAVILAMLLLLTAWVLFMVFLRQLAFYLDDTASAMEALRIIIIPFLFVPGMVGVLFLSVSLANSIGGAAGARVADALGKVMGIALLIAEIKFLFRILELIGTLRQVIARKWDKYGDN